MQYRNFQLELTQQLKLEFYTKQILASLDELSPSVADF